MSHSFNNFYLFVRKYSTHGTNEQTIIDVTEKEQLVTLEEWLGLHKGIIFKIVRAYALTAMDQDDLFQEIVIRVWHSIPVFRHESKVSTWLYRIALNTAISWIRKEQKHAQTGTIDSVQHVLEDNKMPVDERLVWLYREIHQLDEIDRSVILLLLDGFSYREMAAILGISESNVGVKINRIKKQLAGKSKNYEYHGI